MKVSVLSSDFITKERKGVLVISAVMAILIGLAFFYSYGLGFPQASAAIVKESTEKVTQQCEQKLHQYIDQGNPDLETALRYGELQNCNFGGDSGQSRNRGAFMLAGAWKLK
ncbi:MAG: hypothetical protein OQK12_11280 [Motiliproteus sp.]|nr:hypothetical protein [Motiliproteus sp.]MCW9052791.1 hypothetical protein [Motiliproteus sp.]